MFEGSPASNLLCLFLRGNSAALRGKCEVCPPQDELNISRMSQFTGFRGSSDSGNAKSFMVVAGFSLRK